VLNGEGVFPDEDKLKAMKDFETSNSVKRYT